MGKKERFRKAAGLIVIVVMAVVFTGCGYIHKRDIKVISDPPGAKVEIDGRYVGETPMTYVVSSDVVRVSTFTLVLYPNPPIYTQSRMYLQEKTITVKLIPEEEVSERDLFRVYFDMGYRDIKPEDLLEQHNFNYEVKK